MTKKECLVHGGWKWGRLSYVTVGEETTLYRVYGEKDGELGSYWTTTNMPHNPMVCVTDFTELSKSSFYTN